MQAVVERSGLPPAQLRAVAVSEVFKRPPVTLGEAVIRRCAGPRSTFAEARGDFVRAERGRLVSQVRETGQSHTLREAASRGDAAIKATLEAGLEKLREEGRG